MRLHPCPAPAGPLEAAPTTVLCPAGNGEWEGFWSGDDGYYARRVGADGQDEWYRGALDGEQPAPARRAVTPRDVHVIRVARRATLVGRVGSNAALRLLGSSRRRRA